MLSFAQFIADTTQQTHTLTLMICHSKPSTRWGFPFSRSSAPMLTMLQPMDRAEFRANVIFSWILKMVNFPPFGLLMARSSTVSGTDKLIILLKIKRAFIGTMFNWVFIVLNQLTPKSDWSLIPTYNITPNHTNTFEVIRGRELITNQ